MNHHTLLVILAVAVGAGPAWAAAGQVAAGRGFKVSVPAGFVVATGDQVKSLIDMGGLALAATARFEGTGFLASIVVVPVAAPMEGDLGSPALCDQGGAGFGSQSGCDPDEPEDHRGLVGAGVSIRARSDGQPRQGSHRHARLPRQGRLGGDLQPGPKGPARASSLCRGSALLEVRHRVGRTAKVGPAGAGARSASPGYPPRRWIRRRTK